MELRASGPPGTRWTFPAAAGGEDVELLAEPAPGPSGSAAPAASGAPDAAQPSRDAAATTWRYRAAVFAVKDVAVPPISVRYRLADGSAGEVATEGVPLRLRSLLPRDPKERTLADLRAPLPLSIGWPFWAALGALGVLAAGLGWLVARRLRPKPAPAAPAPAVAPDAEALHALEALGASGVLSRGEHRPFYIALAEIAKRYLERRLDAPVLEMTSTETLAFLRGHPHGDALLTALRDLMGAADRVKFAAGEGQAAEARRHLEAARALVTVLETRLRPAPAPRPDGAAPRPQATPAAPPQAAAGEGR